LKQIFEIKDKELIDDILNSIEFGTLALCDGNRPYSLPINFVSVDDTIYFHGAKKGKKIDILKNNNLVSFSVVEPYSFIPSYFSSNDGLACPATQFFKSVIIDGNIEFVKSYEEKVNALSKLMKKLQKEGGYRPFSEKYYQQSIETTEVYKLVPHKTRAKFKFGQHLTKKRFDMIVEHLEKRGDKKDLLTIKAMKNIRGMA